MGACGRWRAKDIGGGAEVIDLGGGRGGLGVHGAIFERLNRIPAAASVLSSIYLLLATPGNVEAAGRRRSRWALAFKLVWRRLDPDRPEVPTTFLQPE